MATLGLKKVHMKQFSLTMIWSVRPSYRVLFLTVVQFVRAALGKSYHGDWISASFEIERHDYKFSSNAFVRLNTCGCIYILDLFLSLLSFLQSQFFLPEFCQKTSLLCIVVYKLRFFWRCMCESIKQFFYYMGDGWTFKNSENYSQAELQMSVN